MDLEAFELVLLRAADGAPGYDEAEVARIQAEHLAHHDRLRESGLVVTNGPVRDQADVTLRGLAFYRTGSLAEARQLAEADRGARRAAGSRDHDLVPPPPGTMSKPGRTITI